MKKCHACGQKLPLRMGDVVSGQKYRKGRFVGITGIVNSVFGDYANVTEFQTGESGTFNTNKLTRLHGYFRITEREAL